MTIRRRGTSLFELMVVISMLAVILPAVTIALAGIAKAVRRQSREEEAARIAERLVHQFRSDLHRAEGSINVTANQLVCHLANDVEITYTLPADASLDSSQTRSIDWIERAGSRVLRRQSYQLATGEQASFHSDRAGKLPAVELRIESESKLGSWRAVALVPHMTVSQMEATP
jgi:type II secretory pathway pseudopilin PulG